MLFSEPTVISEDVTCLKDTLKHRIKLSKTTNEVMEVETLKQMPFLYIIAVTYGNIY